MKKVRKLWPSLCIDKACDALVGHTNWSFADEIIPSDTVQCGVGENVEHVIVIFKDPIEKEDE
tara:strand:- start:181 stop:369 length:189 start_codon:yes stop_codon:yes gene_type:complete